MHGVFNSPWKDKVVVITGGSRGLGLEMARVWIKQGASVSICSRTDADLIRATGELCRLTDQEIGDRVFSQMCDITSQEQVERFVSATTEHFGAIDVVVNNAGIIQTGPVACMTLDDYRQAMDTHFWGPLFLIQAALPQLRERQGRIVNIASIGGEIGVPHLVPYCASKFALAGLSEGLRAELNLDAVSVTTVIPGLMRTGSPRNALFKGRHRDEYRWFSISGSLPIVSINSERAAHQIVKAARRRQAYISLSAPAKVGIRLHGIFPGLTARVLSVVNCLLPRPGGIGAESRRGAESTSKWSPSRLTKLTETAAIRNNEVRS